MTPLQVIFQEAAPWYFYLVLLIMVSTAVWLGYRAIKSAWALFGLPLPRTTGGEAFARLLAIKIFGCMLACGYLVFVIFMGSGIWLMVDANFLSFRLLDVSATNIRVSYEWHILDRELRLPDVQSVTLVHIPSRRASGYRLDIQTTNGEVFRSVTSYDEAVIGDCRRIADGFHKNP
jgi:hypothetical protein